MRQLADETQTLVLQLAERLIATLRQFEPELRQLGQRLSAVAKRIGEFVNKYADWVRKEATDLWHLVKDAVQELPGWEWAREKYDEVSDLCVSDGACAVFVRL